METANSIEGWAFGLTRANIDQMPTHIMSYFLLPKKVYKNFDGIHRRFLWDKDEPGQVGWDIVYRPKAARGLGIRKSYVANLSLIAKLGRRIIVQFRLCEPNICASNPFSRCAKLRGGFLCLERNFAHQRVFIQQTKMVGRGWEEY